MRGETHAIQLVVGLCTRGAAFRPRVHSNQGKGWTRRTQPYMVELLLNLEHDARSQGRDGSVLRDCAHVELEDAGLLGNVVKAPVDPAVGVGGRRVERGPSLAVVKRELNGNNLGSAVIGIALERHHVADLEGVHDGVHDAHLGAMVGIGALNLGNLVGNRELDVGDRAGEVLGDRVGNPNL